MQAPSARSRSSATLLRWGVLLLSVIAPLLLAMRCANEDLTGEFTLELLQDRQTEVVGIQVPYIGRLSLDVGVDAQQSGDIELRIQAQTSGDPDVLGCEAIRLGRVRDVQANPWDGVSTPTDPQGAHTTIGNVSVRTGIALNEETTLGRYTGLTEIATPRTLVRVYTTIAEIQLWDLDGNIVPPVQATEPASCDGIFVTIYEMPADRTRIGYLSDEPRLDQAILEDCTAQRVVDRVCPGSSGPQEEYTLAVSAGTRHVERIPQLGVGDTLVVEASCQGACPASLSAFAWVEPLGCRTRNDCSGGRYCTNEGYCIKEPPPSCQLGSTSGGMAGLLAALALLARGVRRRRR